MCYFFYYFVYDILILGDFMRLDYKDVILGTSCYKNCDGGNRLSISLGEGKSLGYDGNSYKDLAPEKEYLDKYKSELEKLYELKDKVEEYKRFKKKIEDEYIESFYETRLKDLNLKSMFYRLHNVYGDDLILLCYEDVGEFCHRRLIADWIELKTGIFIPEVKVINGEILKVNPSRYTKSLKKYVKK